MTTTDETVANKTDTMYTEVAGCDHVVNGEWGHVTAFTYGAARMTGAFIRLWEREATIYAELGAKSGSRGQYHEVISAREITRDEFDALSGLSGLRREMGWVA